MSDERFQQVAQLFRDASARDPRERSAWLDDACGNDTTLRREVDSLLAIDEAESAKTIIAGGPPAGVSPIPQTIGAYVIAEEIGRGGMGVVYRAEDQRLGRAVAIKALPGALSSDPRFLQRFEREARLLASLDHVNIAKVHHLEEVDGARYLILEYIPGPTLHERLAGGALSVDDALGVAHQIALGIEAAHRQGVIHRDLKPANIKVMPDGRVKVLDFGLAKSFGGDATETRAAGGATGTGAVMGTPGYMSPEQALGEAVGPATDAWAFGCVLYECLSGAQAFRGDSLGDAIGAVLQRDPDWLRLPDALPPRVHEMLRNCLKREADDRLASMATIRAELEAALGRAPAAGGGDSVRAPNNLPSHVSSFIGRAGELHEIRDLLDETRLLTLTGSGGCGKTRLSLELADAICHSERFPHGVWFVELAALTDGSVVPQAIATAAGVKEQPGEELADTLREHLSGRQALLLVDNCEHLLDACATLVDDLLRHCPKLILVTTSREGLGIDGETTYRVPSMSLPDDADGTTAAAAAGYEAIELFTKRAKAANPKFELTDDNAGAVARICRRVDGIPLAIELAAARVRALGVDEIERRLDDSFRILTGGSRTAVPRHKTLQATIEWSYDLLTEEEKTLLRRLSVFAGGFTLEAAEKVCSDDAVIEIDEPEE